MSYKRCYARVSLKAVRENLMLIKAAAGEDSSLLTVVKANAYGHGSIPLSKAVEDITDLFGVACLEEALTLRNAGIKKPILVLGYTSPSQFEELVQNDISASIYDEADAKALDLAALSLNKTASAHIATDTGMTRIGFRACMESAEAIKRIDALPNLRIDGIFTHLSCADMLDSKSDLHTQNQLREFDSLIEMVEKKGCMFPLKHAYNSAGIFRLPQSHYNCVRSGLITYGMYPSTEIKENFPGLKPALSWYAHVIHVADVEENRAVSYGATYRTKKPVTKIATISAGYADGYPRSLSNKGSVLIHGQFAPIIGRICMDQFMVDVSEILNVQKEDIVTLIGTDGAHTISADEIADADGTINYEVTCRISPRVERIYTKDQ